MIQVAREKLPQEALDHMQLHVIHMLEGWIAIQRARRSWGPGPTGTCWNQTVGVQNRPDNPTHQNGLNSKLCFVEKELGAWQTSSWTWAINIHLQNRRPNTFWTALESLLLAGDGVWCLPLLQHWWCCIHSPGPNFGLPSPRETMLIWNEWLKSPFLFLKQTNEDIWNSMEKFLQFLPST